MDKITATPIGNSLWAIECSVCGVLAVTEDAVTDLLSRDHLANHVEAR